MTRFFKYISILILTLMMLILVFVPISVTHGTSGNHSGRPLIIAHRGASGVAPENTMPAIDSALASGADYIEIDVHLSKDGAVIVMHDKSVDRTTDGKGEIAEMTVAEIKTLDAGSWFNETFTGTRVPTLEEVISQIDGKARLLIEIKKMGVENEGLEEAVIRIIRDSSAGSWCEVQSFNDEVLELFHEKAPEIILHKLIVFKYRFLPYAFDGGITRFSIEKYDYVKNINIHYRFFNKSLCKLIKGGGKKIFLWGCREESPCFPFDNGCDGIITDFPANFINTSNVE
jgi:glycerophosphoryl diester phosphodiesterase